MSETIEQKLPASMTSSWHSYPKLFSLGHRAISGIFEDAVLVEEKVDGSQFSFGIFGGELRCKSKSQQLVLDAPEKMFTEAVQTVRELAPLLKDGWTYRGEYLSRPKHNVLAYDRIPAKHIILFDINSGNECYLSPTEKEAEAKLLGLECVPNLFVGKVESPEKLADFLERPSILGGQKVEGVVVKNYSRFNIDGKAMMGKFVSELFKEVAGGEWRRGNPAQNDIIERLILSYRTPARFEKAIQHLKEAGALDNSPKDIGALMKECSTDVHSECADEIKEALFKWAWPKIARGLTGGLPQWYKERLLKDAFTTPEAEIAKE